MSEYSGGTNLDGGAYDVVIAGSGAAGMLTAIRAHDLGLRAAVFEKTHFYGGTSATSGGQLWIPGHHLLNRADDRAAAERYLQAIGEHEIDARHMRAYLDTGPAMLRYLSNIGVAFEAVPGFPDYFSEYIGALEGRAVAPVRLDAADLGEEWHRLREPAAMWKLFDRYSIDTFEIGLFAARLPGWRRAFLWTLTRYWLDLKWRRKTRRDRRLTLGNALVGRLRKAMMERNIPLLLNTRLIRLTTDGRRVRGVILSRDGVELSVTARRAVVLAAGGFEHNQELRDLHLPLSTRAEWSLTPRANTGDALIAAEAVGAGTAHLQHCWWAPVMELPDRRIPNLIVTHGVFRMPHSLLVNRNTERFVNEASSYDRVGHAMVAKARTADGHALCWMIFDTQFRSRYAFGGLLPSDVMPDTQVPTSWWDSYIYKADTVTRLAEKVNLDANKLTQVIRRMNACSDTGVDVEFKRGDAPFDRATAGDPSVMPNPCLGRVDCAPFYAARVLLGDLGTKGGLQTDENARVLDRGENVIDGLYACGNTSASIFAGVYPGAGGTLGPALTFAYIAANYLAAAI